MGLNIVKKIVDSGGGEIRVKSRPGLGTTFTLLLPAAGKSDWTGPAESLMSLPPLDYYREKRIEPEPYCSEKGTILIAEDNLYMLSYLVSSLKRSYNIYYGSSGREALEQLTEMPRPQLIISDIMMDGMDGYSFFRKVKERRELCTVPFIFLTAKNSREDIIKGLSEGAVDYISKPFKIDELQAKIDSLISLLSVRERERGRELEERVLRAIRSPEGGADREAGLEQKCRSFGITRREVDVLRLIFKGYESKEISYELGITFNTVRSHIRHIYEKCRVQNRVELINLFKG